MSTTENRELKCHRCILWDTMEQTETQIDLKNILICKNQNQQKESYSSDSQGGHIHLKVWYISITQELVRIYILRVYPRPKESEILGWGPAICF